MENTLKSIQPNEEPEHVNVLADFADHSNKEVWETNHRLITGAIAYCMRINQRMPSKTELAEKTGLSRVTVHQHLKKFMRQLQEEQKEQFSIIAANVLAGVVKYAMNGDARAARLYFEVMEKMNSLA